VPPKSVQPDGKNSPLSIKISNETAALPQQLFHVSMWQTACQSGAS